MKVRALTVGLSILTGPTTAQPAQPAPLGVIQSLAVVEASLAVQAVGCHLRPAEWGQAVHDKAAAFLAGYAGDTFDMHPATPEESGIALRSLARHEAEAQRQVNTGVACQVLTEDALTNLDDLVDGARTYLP